MASRIQFSLRATLYLSILAPSAIYLSFNLSPWILWKKMNRAEFLEKNVPEAAEFYGASIAEDGRFFDGSNAVGVIYARKRDGIDYGVDEDRLWYFKDEALRDPRSWAGGFIDDDHVYFYTRGRDMGKIEAYTVYRRVRPEQLWGIVWLPAFWIFLLSFLLFVFELLKFSFLRTTQTNENDG